MIPGIGIRPPLSAAGARYGGSIMVCSPASGWADISEAVFFHAERQPDAVALIEGKARLTYGELASLTAAASIDMAARGIASREVVGVMMPATIDHVVLTLGLIRAGAVPLELPAPQRGQIAAGSAGARHPACFSR